MRRMDHTLPAVLALLGWLFGNLCLAPAAEPPVVVTSPAPPLTPTDLEQRYHDLSRKYDDLQRKLDALIAQPAGPHRSPIAPVLRELPPTEGKDGPLILPPGTIIEKPEGEGIEGLEGEEEPEFKVRLEEGLRIESADQKLKFLFRNLSQAEYVGVAPASQLSPGGFAIPRQRLYFIGDVDEYMNFYTVYQAAYGDFDLLDMWIELKFAPEFRVRGGHFRSPFLYEMYTLPEDKLISTERSVVNNTVIPERQTGIMALGELFDKRVYYSMGLFNGPSHQFSDTNTSKDFIGQIDYQPFLLEKGSPFQHLHLVGSIDFGQQDATPPVIQNYRLSSESDLSSFNSETTLVSPVWLTFDPRSAERGGRLMLGGELVWFHDGFTLLASGYGGHRHFVDPEGRTSRVPWGGYQVTTAYFITGEEFAVRDEIRPLRDFDPRDPLNNPGAIELFARFANLNVGRELLDRRIAVPEASTNEVNILDVGWIWYLNQSTGIWFAWQHSELDNPIRTSPTRTTSHYDLFTVRMQFFF